MEMPQSTTTAMGQLWNQIEPLSRAPLVLAALRLARRNPKTALALGVASVAGALIAGMVSRSGKARDAQAPQRKARERRLISAPFRTNGKLALTQ